MLNQVLVWLEVLALVANQVGFATAKLLFNTISDTPDTGFEKGEWVKQTQALTQAKDSAIRENVLKTQPFGQGICTRSADQFIHHSFVKEGVCRCPNRTP